MRFDPPFIPSVPADQPAPGIFTVNPDGSYTDSVNGDTFMPGEMLCPPPLENFPKFEPREDRWSVADRDRKQPGASARVWLMSFYEFALYWSKEDEKEFKARKAASTSEEERRERNRQAQRTFRLKQRAPTAAVSEALAVYERAKGYLHELREAAELQAKVVAKAKAAWQEALDEAKRLEFEAAIANAVPKE